MAQSSQIKRPLHIDEERALDQFEHLIPQLHLTLASVLQGVILVFLVTATKPPTGFDWPSLSEAFIVHHFYLPHIASFLAIIIAWNEFASSILYLYWPLTTATTTLQFALNMAFIAMFSNVDHIGIWIFWLGVVTFIAAIIHTRNRRFIDKNLYLYPNENQLSPTLRSWLNDLVWHYWSLVLLCPLGVARGLHLLGLSYQVVIGGRSVVVFDYVVPAVNVIVGIFLMRIDDGHFLKYTGEIFTKYNSSYKVLKHGEIAEITDAPDPVGATLIRGNEYR